MKNFGCRETTHSHFFNVINGLDPLILSRHTFSLLFSIIRGHLFSVIRGHRPANLDCRISSGDDNRVKSVTPGNDSKVVQLGRSMIEMLGVLAIIAVLSVGGIAGYSKAMEMWKINKTVEGYSYLTQGLMEHIDKLRILQPNNDGTKYYLGDTIKELNLVPEGWSLQSGRLFTTSGSVATVFSRNNRLVYDVELGNHHYDDNIIISDSFSTKLCQELMNKFAKPLHSSLQYAWIFKTQSTVEYYYGDSLCSNRNNCIINMTLSDIQNACNSCIINNEFCILVFEF